MRFIGFILVIFGALTLGYRGFSSGTPHLSRPARSLERKDRCRRVTSSWGNPQRAA